MIIMKVNDFTLFLFFAFLQVILSSAESRSDEANANGTKRKFIVLTVATEKTDGFRRYIRSLDRHQLNYEVIGLGQAWTGGDMRGLGGGQKIRLLKQTLERYKTDPHQIVMFTDAYDVIFNGNEKQILDRYDEFLAQYRVVFSAEGFCWPKRELADEYPLIKFGKRYLNSGMFIGYGPELYKIVTSRALEDKDDDQLFYTMVYLDKKLRFDLKIGLDTMSNIFQNLHGAEMDIEIDFDHNTGKALAHNVAYNTHPLVIHGNGPSKQVFLNYMGNYVGDYWNEHDGCIACAENGNSLKKVEISEYPLVTIAVFVTRPIPFLKEFFDTVDQLKYPSSRLCLYLYNNQRHAQSDINEYLEASSYRKTHIVQFDSEIGEREGKQMAVSYCIEQDCDYLLYLEAEAHLENASTLIHLIERNRGIIGPLLLRPAKLYSNFWGALSEAGYYARSDDYIDIVQRKRIGVWNVPYLGSVYLISREKLPFFETAFTYNQQIDSDMSFCQFARENGHFMYVDNEYYYGFLANPDNFDEDIEARLHPEMWEIFSNRQLWERRYLHADYARMLDEATEIDQPCPDVFEFPFMSETFCRELIAEIEHYGKWSTGNNYDERLAGGYENVPTRDIHMRQVAFERQWLYIMDEYVRPIQEKLFIGYYHQPVESSMMFVVRYKPDEQASLRPHHDASTYSIDVALNRKGIDYQGGGVRFIRYNCTLKHDKIGYSMIFPGRLTHLHEGLPTTSGTRYLIPIFV